MAYFFLLIFLLIFSSIFAKYPYNPLVPYEVWVVLEPYFLPEEHPAKRGLDEIFSKQRVIQSEETFSSAGFGKVKYRGEYKIILGKHRSIPGVVLKIFLDTQPFVDEWRNWLRRIEGAKVIQTYLTEKQFKKFKVPKKWIYPIPQYPAPSEGFECYRKNFILVAEDMSIKNHDEIKKDYKNLKKKNVSQLFMILRDLVLYDSIYIDNTPSTMQESFAFVDTEHFHGANSVNYGRITRYFSTKMGLYWESMIKYGGPEYIPERERF
jgi:hypothetical protein